MSLRTDSPLIEPDVIARVLAKGRSTGAEFSEIYVEDKRSTSAGLDDGKVEQVTSGRDRGAGIRVIAGDTTGFAHTSDLSERGLLAAGSRCSRCQTRRWWRAHHCVATNLSPPGEHHCAVSRHRGKSAQS